MHSPDIALDGGGKRIQPAPDISNIIIQRLQDENEKLRGLLAKSKRIEISGGGGSPVYATGSMEEGHWINCYGGLWEVALAMASHPPRDVAEAEEDDGAGVPISALEELEIRLGGVLYASATSHDIYCSMDERGWDHDAGKEVTLHLGGERGVWLPIRISGWPRRDWTVVMNLDHASRASTVDFDVYKIMKTQLYTSNPDATLEFGEVSFFGDCVEPMLKKFGIGQLSEEEKAILKEGTEMKINISKHLREAGCNDFGVAFIARMDIVIRAAYMMVSQRVARELIPYLAEMQLASQSEAGFLLEVRERYENVLGDWAPSQFENLDDEQL